jgi:uncharacterized protein (DUF58 family)
VLLPRPTRRLAALAALVALVMFAAPLSPTALAVALAIDAALALAAAIDLALAARPREIELERIVADPLSLGEENLVRLRARSFARAPARLEVRDDPPPEFGGEPRWHALTLAPGGEAAARYHVRPRRRGDYCFEDLYLRSTGPLGLMRREASVASRREVRVFPNLIGIERWKLGLRRQRLEELGLHLVRKRGSGTEFEKLRPFADGDELRHVDWKATARRREPITRVYETERSQTVMILIDAGRQMAPWVRDLSRLDYAINAALMLAYVASSRDDNVGLAVFADEVAAYLEPRKGARQYRRFMQALYRVEAEPCFSDYFAAFSRVRAKQKKRSLVVIFTEIGEAEARRDLERALAVFRPRHLPLVVALRDPSFAAIAARTPESADEVYEKVVAREMIEDRARAIRELERLGAHVIDVLPEDFSAAVVSKYLELKARGVL